MQNFGLLVFLIFSLSACSNNKPIDEFPRSTFPVAQNAQGTTNTQSTRGNFQQISISERVYEAQEFKGDRPVCTTGVKTFRSAHELCMNLLDHEFNANCANQKRYETFLNVCVPKGYLPFDGLQCETGILKAGVEAETSVDAGRCYGALADTDFVNHAEFCIGRNIGEFDSQSFSRTNVSQISSSLELTSESTYVLPKELSSERFTHFKASYRNGETTTEVQYRAGLSAEVGCNVQNLRAGTETLRMYTACKLVPGCRAE